jgi:hypothetical protein
MTLPRRAPREVYRVYAEDEFFAYTADSLADTERLERVPAPRTVASGRRLRRLAGSTMLLAAAGALGGFAVLAGRSQPGHLRRPHVGEVAANVAVGRSRLARTHVWRGPARLNGSAGADQTGRHPRHSETVRRIAATAHRTLRATAHGTLADRVLAAARSMPVRAVPAVGESATTAAGVATASVRAPDPGQAEFGFEREARQ